jgi:hypothetical protein
MSLHKLEVLYHPNHPSPIAFARQRGKSSSGVTSDMVLKVQATKSMDRKISFLHTQGKSAVIVLQSQKPNH